MRYWTYECCQRGVSGGHRECSCGTLATTSRWRLSMHEGMARYQLHWGLKPVGPHRTLTDRLAGDFVVRCEWCEGEGLIDTADGEAYHVCGACLGFGRRPPPGAPEIEALRREVERVHPGSLAPYDPSRAVVRLGSIIGGHCTPLLDLQKGTSVVGDSGGMEDEGVADVDEPTARARPRHPTIRHLGADENHMLKVLTRRAPPPANYVAGPTLVVVGLFLLGSGHVPGAVAIGGIGAGAVIDVIEHHTRLRFGRWGWLAYGLGLSALVAVMLRPAR